MDGFALATERVRRVKEDLHVAFLRRGIAVSIESRLYRLLLNLKHTKLAFTKRINAAPAPTVVSEHVCSVTSQYQPTIHLHHGVIVLTTDDIYDYVIRLTSCMFP